MARKVNVEKPNYSYKHSNSLIEGNFVTSNSPNRSSRASNSEVEKLIKQCSHIINPTWEKRHAKAIYKVGLQGYREFVRLSEKYGRNPEAYLAHLVNECLRSAD